MTSQDNKDDDLLVEVSKTARKLSHLKLTHVQVEVLRELMNGLRTMSELTFTIFHSRYTDDGYETHHSRVLRAVKSLESRGFVSKKRIFGRDKPYGLTPHGIACIASIVPRMEEPRVFTRSDSALFLLTALAGLVAWQTLHPVWANAFTFLLGMTVLRTAMIIRRIA